jgi:hypothetical protein
MLKSGHIFFSPEDGGAAAPAVPAAAAPAAPAPAAAAAAATPGAAAPSSAGGNVSRETPAAAAAELSLRAQLAARVKEDQRDAYEKWAGRFTDDGAFFDGLLEARAAASKRPPIPDEKSSAEDRNAFFRQLGKPETAEAYKFDDSKYDDTQKALLGEYGKFAYDLDLTQAQAEKLHQFHDAQMAAAKEQLTAHMKTARAANEAALKQKWGADFDTNVALANVAGAHFFKDQAELEAFNQFARIPLPDGSVAGNHPVMLNMLAQVGRALAGDQTIAKMSNPARDSDIQGKIDAITQEAIAAKKMPYESPYHERLEPLYKQLHGDKPLNHQGW